MRVRGPAQCGYAVRHSAGTRFGTVRVRGSAQCGYAVRHSAGTRFGTVRVRGPAQCGYAVVGNAHLDQKNHLIFRFHDYSINRES